MRAILQTMWHVTLRSSARLTVVWLGVAGAGVAMSLTGCKDLTGSPGLPAGTNDPSYYNSPVGALGMRNAALVAVEQTLPSVIAHGGLLTDELEDFHTGASAGVAVQNNGTVVDALDERLLREGVSTPADNDYGHLQQIRSYVIQAIGALATYDTGTIAQGDPKVLRGELYAWEGYTEIMLADLFCSGVPLSTLNYQKDFTYRASSTTAQVDSDAIFKFDTALTLSGDSTQVQYLAQVGRGRAWLDLAQYDSAAAAVTSVPDDYQYQVSTPWAVVGFNYLQYNFGVGNSGFNSTVSDREGLNGLPFLSSGDPRTAVDIVTTTDPQTGASLATPWTFPLKYAASLTDQQGFAAVTLASGVEARLIEAEAALHTGDATTWLAKLNHLRATAPIPGTTQPNPQALLPLSDPVDPAARVDTLFAERAAWLFLDSHRQGDLRRLIRQYGRAQAHVYPTGTYDAPGAGLYGTDVTAPIPTAEAANPLFHGCLDRHA